MTEHTPWFIGHTCDHLYDTCPAYQAALPELRRVGWDGPKYGIGPDPDGELVCGWCYRKWRARQKQEAT